MTTLLLIHGAWHGNWSWKKIAPLLNQAGHKVITPNLPGREDQTQHASITLDTYVKVLKNEINNYSEKVALVGHSFGGVIATKLANEIPHKISHLIYICAFLPVNGESMLDVAKAYNHVKQPAGMKVDKLGFTISVEKQHLPFLSFNCCSTDDQEWAIEHICSEPFFPMTEQLSLNNENLKLIPKTYIECSKDNALTVEAQQKMATRYNCNIISLSTDHSPFLSTPELLCETLLKIFS